MATAKLIETHANGADIHHGEICKEKFQKLLEEFSIPKGIFHLGEIEEFGFNRSTGFLWLKQKQKISHKFKNIGPVIYEAEITGFIEKGHLTKITGLKAKGTLIPVAIGDIQVGVPSSDKLKASSPVGLSRVYPISAFEPEDQKNDAK